MLPNRAVAKKSNYDDYHKSPWPQPFGRKSSGDHLTIVGYGLFHYDNVTTRAHRMAWELANEQTVPDGLYICHSCDNPPCVNPSHLWPGSQQENVADCLQKGRGNRWKPVGARNPGVKLTESQAREVLHRRASGESIPTIAISLGVSKSTVGMLCRGHTWKHLQPAPHEGDSDR